MQKKPLDILSTIWGHTAFRPTQEPIIEAVLDNKDVLALLPTGGGKSICFQVPGLVKGGLTLVISPLIALMDDQVKSLKSKGIRACAVTSAMGFREIDILLNNAALGAYDFLYVSPERLQTPVFKERFKQMPIPLIVVDEAHCISEWGHDFRPSYLNIKSLRESRPDIPIIALTATATQRVKEDIVDALTLRNPYVHEVSFYRENLSYEVVHTPNKMGSIIAYCHGKDHMTGIVYCATRKAVKELAKVFMSNKLHTSMYHGGMSPDERSESLNQWMSGNTPIMIATNAFGMGIDKPNVRYVLHFDFPENLESYVQEAGRGGRDGLQARSIVFVDGTESEAYQTRFQVKFPSIQHIKLCYEHLLSYLRIAVGSGKDETYPIDLNQLAQELSMNYIEVYNMIKILELNQELHFNESAFQAPKVRLLVHGMDLYNFQIKYPETHPVIQVIERIIGQNEVHAATFQMNKVSSVLKISEHRLNELLTFLDLNGIIDYAPAIHLPTVTFLNERRPDDYFQLSYESYTKRKELAQLKLDSVNTYLNSTHCRSQHILSYFGQESDSCMACDVCLRAQIPIEQTEEFILEALSMPLGYLELIERIPLPNEDLKRVIRDMQLSQKIQLIDGKFYR
ncbi:MAG: ATP-dependent DNA helicase RecQ [Flavobacteriales bacterium]